MKAVAPMPKPVTLVAIKADPKLADLRWCGSRGCR